MPPIAQLFLVLLLASAASAVGGLICACAQTFSNSELQKVLRRLLALAVIMTGVVLAFGGVAIAVELAPSADALGISDGLRAWVVTIFPLVSGLWATYTFWSRLGKTADATNQYY